MSYNDSYGHEPRRSSRRAPREPAGPAKVQGSTAAAILVFVAIVGFGIGALIGNSGDDTDGTAAQDQDPASQGSPEGDQSANPDDTEGEEPAGDSTSDGEESSVSVTLEMAESAPANEELEYTVRTDPPQPGLVLGVERRLPGEDWVPFGETQLTVEIEDDGERSGHVITGITGESEWRFVGEIDGQRVESNVATAEITEADDDGDDEEDRSGSNSGDG